MKVLITGAAGFIGFHTALALLRRGVEVIGVDNLNSYYDVQLKEARLARLVDQSGFTMVRADIADREAMAQVFARYRPSRVINLAAQAGVRYGLQNPHSYVDANVLGFLNILEGCRHNDIEHLVYASTSSVYGANTKVPFSTHDRTDHPVSFYAATKKANEMMAHSYAHLYRLPVTGLRFFTVYGPWGRPDMSLFLFTRNILADEPIDVFNNGNHTRDFTFIDDVVEGIVRVLDKVPAAVPTWSGDTPDTASSSAPYSLYNIGNNAPVPLMCFIEAIEQALGRKAIKNYLPLQLGDVPDTFADIDSLVKAVGFSPSTPIEDGVKQFVDWYVSYYGHKAG